jgi:hypothetical protein
VTTPHTSPLAGTSAPTISTQRGSPVAGAGLGAGAVGGGAGVAVALRDLFVVNLVPPLI